jgi:hypothetical protein
MRIAHFVGMDSLYIERHVNAFLEDTGDRVLSVQYQTTYISDAEDIEYSVLVTYRPVVAGDNNT